jgi:hypothetical protein
MNIREYNMVRKWSAGIALALVALAPLAVAEDSIGKGPVVVPMAPIEQSAESVARVEMLEKAENQTKLFSTVGGDPAINGEYVFMVVYSEDMTADNATFMIGDFNSWEIVEQTKDAVTLKISRSWIDDASGDIKTAEEKWRVPMVKPDAKELTITIVP